MKPVDFAGRNRTYVAEGCGDLPIEDDGLQLISCWEMTWRERFSALIFGRVWLSLAGKEHPPVLIIVKKGARHHRNREH